MHSLMTAHAREEMKRLRLVCCCEECAHERTPSDDDPAACDLLYPTAPHRRASFDALRDGERFTFCKMFEAK